MFHRIGQEAIHFQVHSSLMKGLTKVFQDTIDYRNNLKFGSETAIMESRITQVYKYVRNTTVPNMVKTIGDNTNLIVTKVVLTGTDQLTGMFAVNLGMDNDLDAEDVLNMQTGQISAPTSVRESLEEMMQMHENLNIKTGKLSSAKFGKTKQRKISCVLYMDVLMAFLLHDYIPVGISETLTAEELAAIYTHEIGHVLTMVERSGDYYLTIARNTEHLSKVVKNDDKKKAVEAFVELGIPMLNELSRNGAISKTSAETISAAIKTGSYLLEQEEDHPIFATIGLVYNIIDTLMTVASYTLVNAMIVFHIMQLVNSLTNEFAFLSTGKKQTDTQTTKHTYYQLERMADEFVSRHGGGADLASALNKLDAIFGAAMVTNGSIFSTRLRKSTLFTMYLNFCVGLFKLLGNDIVAPFNYEEQRNRIKRLLQNANAMFKNQLKVGELSYFVGEYTRLEKELDIATKGIGKKTHQLVQDYLLQYVNPITVLAMLTTGRLTNDYEKHQNQIEDLINNKLYAISAKFKNLSIKA